MKISFGKINVQINMNKKRTVYYNECQINLFESVCFIYIYNKN